MSLKKTQKVAFSPKPHNLNRFLEKHNQMEIMKQTSQVVGAGNDMFGLGFKNRVAVKKVNQVQFKTRYRDKLNSFNVNKV